MKQIEVVFLGTNGWFPTETGDTPCVLIKTPDFSILFDAGNGLRKADQYLKTRKGHPVFLFLSHFHIDHISGLHFLAKFSFPQGLMIGCHQGGKKILETFVNQPFTMSLADLPFKTKVIELKEGRHRNFPFGLLCRNLIHSTTCYGYRLEIGKKAIAYCTDTGRCPAVLELAQGADLLILECAHRPGETSPGWPHLNPEEAALTAKEAGVRKLVLMHFDAHSYPSWKERQKAHTIARKIFPSTLAARDGDRMVL